MPPQPHGWDGTWGRPAPSFLPGLGPPPARGEDYRPSVLRGKGAGMWYQHQLLMHRPEFLGSENRPTQEALSTPHQAAPGLGTHHPPKAKGSPLLRRRGLLPSLCSARLCLPSSPVPRALPCRSFHSTRDARQASEPGYPPSCLDTHTSRPLGGKDDIFKGFREPALFPFETLGVCAPWRRGTAVSGHMRSGSPLPANPSRQTPARGWLYRPLSRSWASQLSCTDSGSMRHRQDCSM